MTGEVPLLEVEDLTVHFTAPRRSVARGGDRTVHALCGVSFSMSEGETLGIVGESGSGKTTLLKTVIGLNTPTAGRMLFRGEETGRASSATRRGLSRELGVVFQDPYSSLDPRMTVSELLEEPLRIRGGVSRADMAAAARDALDRVRVPSRALERFPHEFSGGQRQRIAIARSLMSRPSLIVLDEPVSALDVSVQQEILALLEELRAASGVAFLLVAHDLAVVAGIADRIGVMYGGRMLELGTAEDVTRRPRHPYTRALLDAVPIPDPVRERERARGPRVPAWPGPHDRLPPCPVG
jgi:ABC-type glutathione transport system ATPase component